MRIAICPDSTGYLYYPYVPGGPLPEPMEPFTWSISEGWLIFDFFLIDPNPDAEAWHFDSFEVVDGHTLH